MVDREKTERQWGRAILEVTKHNTNNFGGTICLALRDTQFEPVERT